MMKIIMLTALTVSIVFLTWGLVFLYLMYLYNKKPSKQKLMALIIFGLFIIVTVMEPSPCAIISSCGFPIVMMYIDNAKYHELKEEEDEALTVTNNENVVNDKQGDSLDTDNKC